MKIKNKTQQKLVFIALMVLITVIVYQVRNPIIVNKKVPVGIPVEVPVQKPVEREKPTDDIFEDIPSQIVSDLESKINKAKPTKKTQKQLDSLKNYKK